MTFTENSTLTP